MAAQIPSDLASLHRAVRAYRPSITAALCACLAGGAALEDLVLVVVDATAGAPQVRIVNRARLAATMAARGASLARLSDALGRVPAGDVVRVMSVTHGRTVVGDLAMTDLAMPAGGRA